MAKKSRPTFQKREREKARIQKQKDKEARRLESKERKAAARPIIGDEDPDIAGIRPGPQPLPAEFSYFAGRAPDNSKDTQDENL